LFFWTHFKSKELEAIMPNDTNAYTYNEYTNLRHTNPNQYYSAATQRAMQESYKNLGAKRYYNLEDQTNDKE